MTEYAPYYGFDEGVSTSIHQLARTISRAHLADNASINSTDSAPGKLPVSESNDPRLDPESPDFDSKFWVRNLRKIIDSDPKYKFASLGVAYKGLRAHGIATDADYQSNLDNAIWKFLSQTVTNWKNRTNERGQFDILKPMDGLLRPGELTVVLGRPGAGCSTFLKTIACNTYGFHVDKNSIVSYDGLTPHEVKNHYRGDVVYCAETETHFPHLTVGQTLQFAAKMRTPQSRPSGISREQFSEHMTNAIMATYGLSHTRNTKVGNDFVRGVSGGERKRVSIAEVALANAPLQCWDNSTRGLDAATALEFIRALKTSADILHFTPLIAIYQCSQDAYDLFDKVILLYEGYQIFFGDAISAKQFFIDMGYECPPRQTVADFLTSLTNPAERVVRPGFEDKVPRTAKEFYDYWQESLVRQQLLEDIDLYFTEHTENSLIKESHNARQAQHTNPKSPYMVSYLMQVRYVMQRNIQRTRGDPSVTLFQILGNSLMSMIVCSIFYNLPSSTGSFYSRTAALFFAVLFNSFSSLLEIFSLYEARPIVEKHKNYALYHPSADALASIVTEFPTKLCTCVAFNLIFYFMVNFRRDPGHFFFYLFINFLGTLVMSHLFRSVGAATKSLSQAMTPASILLLALTIFTGFVIPTPKMHGWCRWINYINPIGYVFEALMANEFSGREFVCSEFVPRGPGYPTTSAGFNRVCSTVGARIGMDSVQGSDYIASSYEYYRSHKWRNLGIVIGYIVFFLGVYLIIVEHNKGARQKGEVLLFQQAALKRMKRDHTGINQDVESGKSDLTFKEELDSSADSPEKSENPEFTHEHNNIFHWRNLTYTVQIKTETRTILSDIDGWVKPGQVTALMGASGAGKTTLLNALSDRLTSGTITSGTRMVNGNPLDNSFQRSIGYVQQQDLHLETSTVREALQFSAYLRQPSSVSKKDKDAYVDYVISLLEMTRYSDAVVGVAGEGLNVEQRKRLTIGVELVAKPKLLVFLDEPTSGLDSQTAWSICKLIRKLADSGQAILCTIHQPSAILLQEFDRLLFLQKGGKTVYFGDLGDHFSTLIKYFESHGAGKCPPDANPAEWMLHVIGAAPGSHATQDYYEVWRNSDEYKQVQQELDTMAEELVKLPKSTTEDDYKKYATSLLNQYLLVTKRVFEQYYRTPSYIYSKVGLSVLSCLFNGFTFFKADKSLQGMQNQMFSVFMFLSIFLPLSQQYLPNFVSQRDLYEARERPSKTFSWFAFITAQITAEIPWQILTGTLAFFCWYYPIGLYNNAIPTNTVNQRGAFMWFSLCMFFVYSSTLPQWCISFMELADNAANLAMLLFSITLAFCGVLVPKEKLPGFWIFMYRCNPFTYLVSVVLSTGLANSPVECASNELLKFVPINGTTCGQYMKPYMSVAKGYLLNSAATDVCEYCTVNTTNTFLKSIGANYHTRGRDIGIFICFIVVNVIGTILFYFLFRVPHGDRSEQGGMFTKMNVWFKTQLGKLGKKSQAEKPTNS
ncbi:pleiotropic ABC efflux transporter of multiple drugs Cdr1p [[Candida] anglica]|uniref:Pleiotropic ABC efflux transporter of multiple drugs Cdr1p n=1 Tax=[Candida] anglica TaxID=148631 RepID=A0ABP0EHS0_9ASCO